jgi:hypothetical protein
MAKNPSQSIYNYDDGRCSVISLDIDDCNIKLIYVYFPCFSSNADYTIDLGNCVGFIENVVQPYDNIVIIGDVNFACSTENSGYLQPEAFFDKYDMAHCGSFVSEANPLTYVS